VASLIFNRAIDAAARGQIDFDSDSFAVMLVEDSYAPDKDADEFRSDVTGEASGTGYDAGGADVVVDAELDNTTDRVDVTLGGNVWDATSVTARGAVYYQKTGNAATDRLVCYIDFGTDVTSTNASFTLTDSILRYQNAT
jgi:hypothetical protein